MSSLESPTANVVTDFLQYIFFLDSYSTCLKALKIRETASRWKSGARDTIGTIVHQPPCLLHRFTSTRVFKKVFGGFQNGFKNRKFPEMVPPARQ